jgi:hypothetical protein
MQATGEHMIGALIRLRAGHLDRRLAAGAPASGGAMLRARARQLLERRERATLVMGWQRVLEDARRGPRPVFSSAIPVRRDAVLIAEPTILAIQERLRGDAPVDPSAVARLRVLLTDGGGPLYHVFEADELRLRLLEVLADFDVRGRQ